MLHVRPDYAEEIRSLLETMPEPPRPFRIVDGMKKQYMQPMFRSFPILGALAFGLTTYVVIATASSSGASVLAVLLGYLTALTFLLSPAAIGAWYARAIRRGRLVKVILNGQARDKWVMSVPHERGHVDMSFEPPDWSTGFRAGRELWAIVDPSKPKVLLLLGAANAEDGASSGA